MGRAEESSRLGPKRPVHSPHFDPRFPVQAYRRLALQKHPDKNPDNPNAASEFAALQKAYELLCDGDARAALDNFLR